MNVLLLVSPGALVLKQEVSSDLGPITNDNNNNNNNNKVPR